MFNGVRKGFELIGDWMRLLFTFIRAGNAQAVTEGVSIGEQWLHETFSEAGQLRLGLWGLVFGNADPWKDSRRMLRSWEAEWSVKS